MAKKDSIESVDTRYSLKNPANCADLIWSEVLAANVEALAARGLGDPAGLMKTVAETRDKALPSDWLIIYAIKQALVQPELCGFEDPRRGDFGIGDFEKPARKAIIAAGPKEKRPNFRMQDLDAVVKLSRKRRNLAEKALEHHGDAIRQGVCEIVNKWRGPEVRPLTVEELFDLSKVAGPGAIAGLRARLFEGTVAVDARGREMPPLDPKRDNRGWLRAPDILAGKSFRFVVAGPGDPRTRALKELCDSIFGPAGLQIANPYAPGMRSDLSALATELFRPEHRTRRGCRLPILYLALHGRSVDHPPSSYAELVDSIWRFYSRIRNPEGPAGTSQDDPHGRALLDRGLPEPRSLDQIVEMIRAIQQLMVEHPAILIFDGYRAGQFSEDKRDYSLHNLVSAVGGDRLLDLVERLAMIPTPDRNGPIDVDAFRQNRFVILSDTALYGDMPDERGFAPIHPHPALRLVNGSSIRIPPPPRAKLQELIPFFGNQNPGQIAWIRREFETAKVDEGGLEADFRKHSEKLGAVARTFHRAPVSESVMGVLSVLLKLGRQGGLGGREQSTTGAVLDILIKHELIPLLRQRPNWLIFLHLIAIASGGLRPKTLARVFEYFEEARGAPGRLSREEINDEIAAMLEACHGIVGVSRSDHLEALRGRPLPLLFRQSFSYGHEVPTDRAIEFAFDQVRDAFIDHAREQNGKSYVYFLHLLLAEEAYEQFTHLARYDDLQGEDSLHRNSRLLAALFHGAASLGDDSLEVEPLYSGAGRFFPDNPTERWVKLYNFAYRKNLDRPPLFHLVRSYDAAQTKLDILLALARPQLCHETEVPPWHWPLPRLRPPGPAGATTLRSHLTSDTLAKLLSRFARELRGAAKHVSRDLAVDWEAVELPARSPQEGRAEDRAKLGELVLRLTDDPESRDPKVDELSETILDRIDALAPRENIRRYLGFAERQVMLILRGSRRAAIISLAREKKIAEGAMVPISIARDLIEYLNLYAEVLGYRADRDYGAAIADGNEVPSEEVVQGFAEAFAAFYVAEILRNQIFWSDPTTDRDAITGRAARGFIRVALKLERFRVTFARRADLSPSPGGWFWRHAHIVADELARHLSRFPRERVGMLTLDATMARYYESKNSETYNIFLTMARECLCSAEPLLLKLGMHNRLRQRFALERSKIMHESARLAIAGGNMRDAERYMTICEADIATFQAIVAPGNVLWANLAATQRAKLQRLRILLREDLQFSA